MIIRLWQAPGRVGPSLEKTKRLLYPQNFRVASRCFSLNRSHHAQYRRFDSGSGPSPFGNATRFWGRWASRPSFYYEIMGAAILVGAFYIYNLEEVPVTRRRRFNVVSENMESFMAEKLYKEMLQRYSDRILPASDKLSKTVTRVVDRLATHAGVENVRWQVHVIQSEDSTDANAFVIPGGKVFIFTSLLPICHDEDGLAAVLGHEIAHNVAKHSAERMSRGGIVLLLLTATSVMLGLPLDFTHYLLSLGFERPASRREETEADYIGLLITAQSCFDPSAAAAVFTRMEQVLGQSGQTPEFLSTHPSHATRAARLKELLPEAMVKYHEAGCSSTKSNFIEFKHNI